MLWLDKKDVLLGQYWVEERMKTELKSVSDHTCATEQQLSDRGWFNSSTDYVNIFCYFRKIVNLLYKHKQKIDSVTVALTMLVEGR
jgi:hypothetical protein